MKILQIAASVDPQWGGPAKIVLELSRAFAAQGHAVTIFAVGEKGGEEKIVTQGGVTIRLFPKSLFSKLWQSYSPRLRQVLAAEMPSFDLVHIHEIWHYPHFAAARAARKTGTPYLITIHGSLEPWALRYKSWRKKLFAFLFEKKILREAAMLHALTDGECEQIRAFGIHTPVTVIPSGINLEDYQPLPGKEELSKQYPALSRKKIILFLGRLHPKKGLDILVRAFGRIVKTLPDTMLLIAGPDSDGYQQEVARMVRECGVAERTIFTGMLTGQKKLAALSAANIFVLPSYSEGFSQAVLEAMAVGLPVIISQQCYFPDVSTKEAGIIIRVTEDDLAHALHKLLSDDLLRSRMGKHAHVLVQERFTWSKISDEMIALYERILGKRG